MLIVKKNSVFLLVLSLNAVICISLLALFFCRYFKPSPRCVIDKEMEICTLYLPKSCPIQIVQVQGNVKTLKQIACLKACKQLHQIGELTDNLVPEIVVEEAEAQKSGNFCCNL